MIKHDDTDFHEGLGEPNLGDVVDVQCRPVKHAEDYALSPVQQHIQRLTERVAEQEKQIGALKVYVELYKELLFCVSNKYPGESRHQTAKRYLLDHENFGIGEADAAAKGNP